MKRANGHDFSMEHNYYQGHLRLRVDEEGRQVWEGTVGTPIGFVTVRSVQVIDETKSYQDLTGGWTSMRVIYAGRYYSRLSERFYYRTSLMATVKRFVRDVTRGSYD